MRPPSRAVLSAFSAAADSALVIFIFYSPSGGTAYQNCVISISVPLLIERVGSQNCTSPRLSTSPTVPSTRGAVYDVVPGSGGLGSSRIQPTVPAATPTRRQRCAGSFATYRPARWKRRPFVGSPAVHAPPSRVIRASSTPDTAASAESGCGPERSSMQPSRKTLSNDSGPSATRAAYPVETSVPIRPPCGGAPQAARSDDSAVSGLTHQ